MGQAPLPVGASSVTKEIALHIGSGGGGGGGGGQMRAEVTFVTPEPNVTGPVGTAAGTPVLSLSSTPITPPSPTVGDTLPRAHISGGTGTTGTWAIALSSLQSPFGSSSIPGQPLPLPENVQFNPATTQVTHVPCINSLQLISRTLEKNINEAQARMKMNKDHEGVLKKMRERMTAEMKGMFGGAMWWENGSPGVDVNSWKRGCEKFEVRYPPICGKEIQEKEGRGKRKRRRESLKLPRKLEPAEADRPEQLVPIRLEFGVGHHKMRDTFVWNLNDPVVTPEVFAQSIVDDYALASSYHSVIVKSIQEQLTDYTAQSPNYDQDSGDLGAKTPVLQGKLDNSHGQWWETWRRSMKAASSRTTTSGATRSRKKLKLDAPQDTAKVTMEGDEGLGGPMAIDDIKLDEELVHEEMRILIELDIIAGPTRLEDQFEWDIGNNVVTPEQFSEIYAQDLDLGGEFKTAIAHSIREQIQMHRKALFLVGYPADGMTIQHEGLRQTFLPSLVTGTRHTDQMPSYTPVLAAVTNSDVERNEKERVKEMNKRRKRNRRGIVVSDRKPIRTHRTPAHGFPELDPATLAPPAAAVANAPGLRRAAATASLTIANILASENDTTDVTLPIPLPTMPVPHLEKKPKCLPTAPTIPSPSPVSVSLESGPPPAISPPPASLESKMKITPKNPAKEMEREAMEKEFADGQYPNWINGAWHCSNCGCPKSMTLGRRRGPLGDKSQCGLCGKFWHRHCRPRPVEYNPDPEFHMRKSSDPKARKKRVTLKAQRTTTIAVPVGLPSPPTPTMNEDMGGASWRPPSPTIDEDGGSISPVSIVSSTDLNWERLNRSHSWLTGALQLMRGKYPDDRFEAIPRSTTGDLSEWRIRCLDCPGKLYKTGPGESLSNYELHSRNRLHRQRVDERLVISLKKI